jgi:5-methylcytosine-specific restriction endonuclease McrA
MMDKVLVLNSDYTPLNVTSIRRGFILVIKGKAEVLRQDADNIVTSIGEFVRPLIIRLLSYVRFKTKPVKLNRKRIFKRDNNECVYCGSKRNLTIDHIIPRSRGGKNTWSNLVTCCSNCNLKKGNRTPEEASMRMNYKAYEPTIFSSIISVDVEELWGDYQKSFV